jgi:hypothetical protein
MDAITLLRADHREVLAMFDKLEQGPTAADRATPGVLTARRRLVTELVMAESAHEAVEEQYFWPTVRRAVPGGDELAAHATAQESEAKHLLQRLDKSSVDDLAFEELIRRVVADGREHIRYEQDVVWPKLRAAITRAELEALGQKMAKAKLIAPTRPHPHTPADPAVLSSVGVVAAATDRLRDAVTGRGRS